MIYRKSNISIETAVPGVYVDMPDATFKVQHYGISPTKTAELSPDDIPEVPYVMIESSGNANIVQGRTVKVQYKTGLTAALCEAASYLTVFTGKIALLNENIDYSKGRVTFKVRNNLSLLSQDFMGIETHYGAVVTLSDYDSAIDSYSLPDGITDVYAAYSDGIAISDNNWNYDYLLETMNFFRPYSDSSTITLAGHTAQQLKDVAENLLLGKTYNTITDSATPLNNLFFPATLSTFRALRQIGQIYNCRLFAAMDGDISFNPTKISTDAETLTLADTDGTILSIRKEQQFTSVGVAKVYGRNLHIKGYSRYASIIDDFNDNGNNNNLGGVWEISTSSALNTVSPTVGNFSASYERGNYGAKLYAEILAGYVKLSSGLNSSHSAANFGAYTGIRLKYRCTSPLYVYLDSAYYKLPAVGAHTEIDIPFASFTGTLSAAAITDIAFVMKDTGTHEFFVDFVKLYPDSAVTEPFYETDIQVFSYTGALSSGEVTLNLPWVIETETTKEVADSLHSFFAGGIDQYTAEVKCPTLIAEVGDIVKLTSSEHGITAQPFEVIAFDFEMTGISFVVTYLLQTAYTLTDLTKRRQNDIDSTSAYFTTTAAEGTGTATQVTFNRPAEVLSGQSRFNYEIKPPSMTIYSVTGTGTSTTITFDCKLGAFDADYFKASRFDRFGITAAVGAGNSIAVTFSRPLSAIDTDFIKAFMISTFGFSVAGTGTSIVLTFDRPVSGIDEDFFTIQKII